MYVYLQTLVHICGLSITVRLKPHLWEERGGHGPGLHILGTPTNFSSPDKIFVITLNNKLVTNEIKRCGDFITKFNNETTLPSLF